MSSPAERNSMSNSSKYDANSPPLYPSTDRFHPLGFSTPQQQQRGNAQEARSYFSAQPKYMLPRARGFHSRNRYEHNEERSHGSTQTFNAGDHDGQGNSNSDTGRQNYSRNWKGYQNKNQRYGGQRHQHNFRHKHQGKPGSYNIDDYYHPSMLEDPWEFLLRNFTRPSTERTERTRFRDSAAGDNIHHAGDSSDSVDEG